MNFCPVPQKTTARLHAQASLDRMERDIGLKCYFAGADQEELKPTKLYVKSIWMPPLPPTEVDSRFCRFSKALLPLFNSRPGQPNLNKFLQSTLKKLQEDDSIVYCHADKGLGPVAVKLDWYIKAGLKPLTDTKTYEIISEEQALEDAKELRDAIFKLTMDYR